jgi:quinol monooxygenase YgiN
MTFRPDKVVDFLEIFEQSQPTIKAMAGCHHVELWQDLELSNVFITHSHWDDVAALNAYRDSTFFKNVWCQTKVLFIDKPIVFSANKV